MFCKKCGSEVNDEAAFCPKCGTPLKAPEPKNQPIPPIMPMSEINDGQKKVVKKGLIIAVTAAAAVLILLVANGARINNFVHRTFSSPEKYYQFAEKKMLKELSSHAGEWYDRYVLDFLNFYDRSIEGKLTVELGEDGQEFIGLLGLAGVDMSRLESMIISGDIAIKDDMVAAILSLNLNKSDILSGNMKMDMDKGMAYFQVPELNETYLGMDMTDSRYDNYDADSWAKFQELNEKLLRACPNQAEIEKLMKRYLTLALSCVDNVSKSKGTLKAEGVEQECMVLDVIIDSGTMQDMVEAVLKKLRDDKDVKALMKNMLKAGDSVTGEEVDINKVYTEFQDNIDQLLDESGYFSYPDEEIVMKVYVDSKGEIKGRSIELGHITIKRLMPEKGSRFGYELSGNIDGITVKLTGSGRSSGGTISGDFQIKYNGAALIELTAKKLSIEDLKSGMLNGRIEVKVASKIGSIIGSVPELSIIEDMQINMDFKTSKRSCSCKIGFIYDNQDMGTIGVAFKTEDGSKISIPSGKSVQIVDDDDDIEEWVKGIRFSGLVDSLKKADIFSTKIMDVLEGIEDVDDIYGSWYDIERIFYY